MFLALAFAIKGYKLSFDVRASYAAIAISAVI
jgi:hypothetical protein